MLTTTLRLYYLMHIIGYDAATSQQIIHDKNKRKMSRSPSRRVA